MKKLEKKVFWSFQQRFRRWRF